MRLVPASMDPPPGLTDLLADLGDGENGFGGTPCRDGGMPLPRYLGLCIDMVDPGKLRPGLVPQTMFWLLDEDGVAVGMVRLRHYLNDALRIHGGNIGYYVRKDRRGRGYGKAALRLALDELRKMGEGRALVTVSPDNPASIKVVEANGGEFEDETTDPATGARVWRYWIKLA